MRLIDKDSSDYAKNNMSLAEECNNMKRFLDRMKENRRSVESLIARINSTRVKSKHAMQYWKSVDPLEYGKWLCIINDADKIMSRVDNSKQQASVVINVDQLCSTNSHNDNLVILETNNNEECNEISEIESPDGQMPKISGVVPTAAKATPSDRSERQLGKKRKAADYIPIGTFTLYLNGGKQGNKRKLHNEGLEWKNGAI